MNKEKKLFTKLELKTFGDNMFEQGEAEGYKLGLKQRVVGMIKIEDVEKMIDNWTKQLLRDFPLTIREEGLMKEFFKELKQSLKELGEK